MSEFLMLVLVIAAATCAVLAIRTPRLLHAALWLASTSALVSVMLYALGAREVAVIELSVGAGLVTILFVFAINIAGDEGPGGGGVIPRWLAWGAVILAGVLLALLVVPAPPVGQAAETRTFAAALWEDRGLDVLVQIALIFAGALGVLGLIGDPTPTDRAVAASVQAPAQPLQTVPAAQAIRATAELRPVPVPEPEKEAQA